jgi:hypothetical protein
VVLGTGEQICHQGAEPRRPRCRNEVNDRVSMVIDAMLPRWLASGQEPDQGADRRSVQAAGGL